MTTFQIPTVPALTITAESWPTLELESRGKIRAIKHDEMFILHILSPALYAIFAHPKMPSSMGVTTLVAGMFLTGCANSLLWVDEAHVCLLLR